MYNMSVDLHFLAIHGKYLCGNSILLKLALLIYSSMIRLHYKYIVEERICKFN